MHSWLIHKEFLQIYHFFLVIFLLILFNLQRHAFLQSIFSSNLSCGITELCSVCHTFKCSPVCTVCFSSTHPLLGSSNPSAFTVLPRINEVFFFFNDMYLLSELTFWISFLYDAKDRLLSFVISGIFLVCNFLSWSSCNIKLSFNGRMSHQKTKKFY